VLTQNDIERLKKKVKSNHQLLLTFDMVYSSFFVFYHKIQINYGRKFILRFESICLDNVFLEERDSFSNMDYFPMTFHV
jgi:hypothetical protein